ncbi:hypothetical protein PENSPDRAFT_653218 [Peniophora sp. CONT]|nr:hypothetical protein PENSPDRAFT_653218 [Peniophora sp. CONT]
MPLCILSVPPPSITSSAIVVSASSTDSHRCCFHPLFLLPGVLCGDSLSSMQSTLGVHGSAFTMLVHWLARGSELDKWASYFRPARCWHRRCLCHSTSAFLARL